MLQFLHFWPLEVLLVTPVSLWHISVVMSYLFMYASLLSGITRCSGLIIFIFCPTFKNPPKSYGSFYWRPILEIKILLLHVLVTTGVLMLLVPVRWQNKEIYVCILTWIWTHIYKCLYVTCVYIEPNMNLYWCLQIQSIISWTSLEAASCLSEASHLNSDK